jgi:hypothetical protein
MKSLAGDPFTQGMCMQSLLNWHLVSETASTTTVGTANRETMPHHNDAAVVSKSQQKPSTDHTTQSQEEVKPDSHIHLDV